MKNALIVLGLLVLVTPATAQNDAPASATIEVRVAPGAALMVDNYATRSRGPVRTFYTPLLARGASFSYELTAVWNEGGKQRKEKRQISVRGGETTVVDFTVGGVAVAGEKSAITPVVKTTQEPATKTRTFNLTYAATIKELPPGKEVSIWIPMPSNLPEQTVSVASMRLPGKEKIGKETQYGNQILHVKGKADKEGNVPLQIVFKVTRKEVKTQGDPSLFFKPLAQERIKRFLEPDKLVPVGGKGLTLVEDKKLPSDQFAKGKLFYDIVNTHMKYSKEGKGWGRGDSDWACDSKFGNCTDFHSLFISLARAYRIPAKFEIGFPLPPERGKGKIGGYHCWAWFLPDGKGWVPVDISEANRHPNMREYYFGNLTEDRVTFSSGRDITLVPPQQGPALNFFVYPYVEVDGQPYRNEKIDRVYAYEDMK